MRIASRLPGPTFKAAALLIAVAGSASMAYAQSTQRVSVSSAPVNDQGNAMSFLPAISANGRFASFTSSASNLVPNDTNGVSDIFVRDLLTGETSRASISSDGDQSNGSSGKSSLSADGRFVAFASNATNLVPNDTNGFNDVFVHDRLTGETKRVSVASDGTQSNASSHTPAISDDGRYIAFESAATNLVPGGFNIWDIFVHDLMTGETTQASVSTSGVPSNGDSRFASISADGRFVSFTSAADNMIPTPPFITHVYVRDRQLGQTTRVSVSSDGVLGNDNSLGSSISADGRYVAFSSFAGNLDANDQTTSEDVFIHDRQTGTTTLISRSTGGTQANSWSFWPNISGDGRYVGFVSDASNLVTGDTNGWRDVFIHDRQIGETSRVSVSTAGDQGDNNSGFFSGPALSFDGRFVAFESRATTLVPNDTNGQNDIFVRDRSSDPPCAPADINCDGSVGVPDLLAVINAWGACSEPCPPTCDADITGDCIVGVADLLMVINNWG